MKDEQFLQPNDELKTLIREGVPPQLRSQVWKAYVQTVYLMSLLKFRAAKYYNELPEDIKFELDDSEKYNKSVLRNH